MENLNFESLDLTSLQISELIGINGGSTVVKNGVIYNTDAESAGEVLGAAAIKALAVIGLFALFL